MNLIHRLLNRILYTSLGTNLSTKRQFILAHSHGYQVFKRLPFNPSSQWLSLQSINLQEQQHGLVIIVDHRYRLRHMLQPADLRHHAELTTVLKQKKIIYRCVFLEQILSPVVNNIALSDSLYRLQLNKPLNNHAFLSVARYGQSKQSVPLQKLTFDHSGYLKALSIIYLDFVRQGMQVFRYEIVAISASLLLFSMTTQTEPIENRYPALPKLILKKPVNTINFEQKIDLVRELVYANLHISKLNFTANKVFVAGTLMPSQSLSKQRSLWQDMIRRLHHTDGVTRLSVDKEPLQGDLNKPQPFRLSFYVKPLEPTADSNANVFALVSQDDKSIAQ